LAHLGTPSPTRANSQFTTRALASSSLTDGSHTSALLSRTQPLWARAWECFVSLSIWARMPGFLSVEARVVHSPTRGPHKPNHSARASFPFYSLVCGPGLSDSSSSTDLPRMAACARTARSPLWRPGHVHIFIGATTLGPASSSPLPHLCDTAATGCERELSAPPTVETLRHLRPISSMRLRSVTGTRERH
jgi:hypothetical protein